MKRLALLLIVALSACVTESSRDERGNVSNLAEAARTNTSLAVEYARAGNYELALEKAKRALSQDDSYAPAHSAIALIYAQRGDEVEASKHYRRAISLDSQDLFTRNNYAIFECEHGRIDDALAMFERVARNKSYNAPESVLLNAGICANRGGKFEKAEGYFREVLVLNPNNADALLQMANIAAKRLDWLRVRAFLQRRDRTVQPTAESLRLAIRAERGLGDVAAAERLSVQLQRDFP